MERDTIQKIKNDFETRALERISDPESAIAAFGFSDLVIEKFGDQLTVEQLLIHAREMTLGKEYTLSAPVETDGELAKRVVMDTAIHWLRGAGHNKESWLGHSNPEIRKFGRRMYFELNPDEYSPDKLAELKEEWNF